MPQQLFYNFCKLVGHDEHNFHSYELMMERMPTYRIQTKNWLWMKLLGERAEDIKGADEAKEEEDLVEVEGKLFSIIAKC